jgi:hypothetical protein
MLRWREEGRSRWYTLNSAPTRPRHQQGTGGWLPRYSITRAHLDLAQKCDRGPAGSQVENCQLDLEGACASACGVCAQAGVGSAGVPAVYFARGPHGS